MNENTIKQGQVIKNTEGYGTVEVLDVYTSEFTGSSVYLVQDEFGSQALAMPDELIANE